MASKSPDRHTFQEESYINRCKENSEDPSLEYLVFWKSVKERDEENLKDLEWQKNNLEYDLRSTEWILEKVRNSDVYAQNLYAAMCNNDFVRLEVIPILKNEIWHCSWRYSGGIIADMKQKGDYIDWYCSGIGWGDDPAAGYVPESTVTEEIRSDLKRLGWAVLPEQEILD